MKAGSYILNLIQALCFPSFRVRVLLRETTVSHTVRCYISGRGFNCLSVPLPTQSAMKTK